MSEYLDSTMLIAEGTLIHYHGTDEQLDLCTDPRAADLSVIGAGAFMHSEKLRRVKLSRSLKKLENKAFASCPSLESVQLYASTTVAEGAFFALPKLNSVVIADIEISASEYMEWIRCGRRTSHNKIFPGHMPKWRVVKEVLAASADVSHKPLLTLPPTVDVLFRSPPSDPEKDSVDRWMECFPFDGSPTLQTEESALVQRMARSTEEYYDAASEEAYDRAVRIDNKPRHKRMVLPVLDDNFTQHRGDRCIVQLTLHYGLFFWQSLRRLVHNGQVYGVYSRRFLSPEPSLNYTQNDVTVYKIDPVNRQLITLTDRAEVREVYAKYKLLSIL